MAEKRVNEAASFTIKSHEDVEQRIAGILKACRLTKEAMSCSSGNPLNLMYQMKFEAIGFHPIDLHRLNLMEQINQTWTYLSALSAARWLLDAHPDAEGFRLSPGAHAIQDLDIMSLKSGIVGAETFAAVTPKNNGKLQADISKLAKRSEKFRYVFFISPEFPRTERLEALERDGVQVWSMKSLKEQRVQI